MSEEQPKGFPSDKEEREKVELYFRDQLRQGRAAVLRNAEDFQEIVFVLERLGEYLWEGKGHGDLGKYKPYILDVAARSPVAPQDPKELAVWRARVEAKYDIVGNARNDAVHQGAFARHLTSNTVKLALILEEALMSGYRRVDHFMVANPICAELWQPLSLVRQAMLANSFSYLPVRLAAEQRKTLPLVSGKRIWPLISDFELAKYLRAGENEIRIRLREKLEAVVNLLKFDDAKKIKLVAATIATEIDDARELLRGATGGHPIVVVNSLDPEGDVAVTGILTPFDLL